MMLKILSFRLARAVALSHHRRLPYSRDRLCRGRTLPDITRTTSTRPSSQLKRLSRLTQWKNRSTPSRHADLAVSVDLLFTRCSSENVRNQPLQRQALSCKVTKIQENWDFLYFVYSTTETCRIQSFTTTGHVVRHDLSSRLPLGVVFSLLGIQGGFVLVATHSSVRDVLFALKFSDPLWYRIDDRRTSTRTRTVSNQYKRASPAGTSLHSQARLPQSLV